MDLLQAFNNFIAKERLFSPGDRLLLAVSGGLDSVVLCELMHRLRLQQASRGWEAGFDFSIAHCNFQLRGAESDRDEAFVGQLGERYGREVLIERFDTNAYAASRKVSIQVAARELRYRWFHQIVDSWAQPACIMTAHHLDDNIETLLMNFFKGTGIAGLRAMLPRQGKIVRPLLFATRTMLQQFAAVEGLSWVEDSSNLSDKYTRNFFRHQVIPLVQEAYPAAVQNLADNVNRFREIEWIYRRAIEQQKKKLLEYKDNEVHIPVLKLQRTEPLTTLVYEIMAPFGFSTQQTPEVIALLDSPSGKYMHSATHRILRHRNWLIISPRSTTEAVTIVVEPGDTEVVYEQGILRLEELPSSDVPDEILSPSPTGAASHGRTPASAAGAGSRTPASRSSASPIAWLDAADIKFPLLLRKWRPGDYFYPLGMRKKKKLARFFIDNKLSLAEKEKIWVVEMNKKIIWIVGLRIDDRYRITTATRRVLKIESGLA
jgi:tRNA(Ile)-lysidine synthase